jgi:hypothetical protein
MLNPTKGQPQHTTEDFEMTPYLQDGILMDHSYPISGMDSAPAPAPVPVPTLDAGAAEIDLELDEEDSQ